MSHHAVVSVLRAMIRIIFITDGVGPREHVVPEEYRRGFARYESENDGTLDRILIGPFVQTQILGCCIISSIITRKSAASEQDLIPAASPAGCMSILKNSSSTHFWFYSRVSLTFAEIIEGTSEFKPPSDQANHALPTPWTFHSMVNKRIQ
jgi:hypothetical protein